MDSYFSDSDSLSESSSYEDQDDVECLYGGQACSILSSLEETIGKIDDFLSFEQVFVHGDIVCSVIDPSGQMGRVINVDLIVDLEDIYGNKIQDVNSKSLQKLRSISVGDYVVNGAWLGKVEKIFDQVTVLFDDGTKCEFTMDGPGKLIPISPDLLEDSQYPFYPGQRVQIEPSCVSKSARWLCGEKKDKRDEGTVFAVDAGIVHVDWLGCAIVSCDKVPAPSSVQDSKSLTLLSCFSHTKWQLGDWCVLPAVDGENFLGQSILNAPAGELIKGNKQSEKVPQRRKLGPNLEGVSVIVKIKTQVDVLWQDGSQSVGIDSLSLVPVNIVDAHEFWPEQFVLENGACENHTPSIQRWGVVRRVDARERTVHVKWSTVATQELTNFEGEQLEETVSAYELIEHPDYSYCLGDAVFLLHKRQPSGLDRKDFRDTIIPKLGTDCNEALNSVSYGRDHYENPSDNYLSCIGIVVDFKDGKVEVKWASGGTSKVAPFEIYRIDKFESTAGSFMTNDDSIEQSNEEMTENKSLGQKRKVILSASDHGESCRKKLWDAFPQSTVGFFTSITSNLFGSLRMSLLGAYNHVSEEERKSGEPCEEEIVELCKLYTIDQPMVTSDDQTFGETKLKGKVKDALGHKDHKFSSASKSPQCFRQFDMVSGCSDHHFVDSAGKSLQLSQVKKSWLKKVHQEWRSLEQDLPETIYVRGYEDRMDLLRAAVVGAPGTPYHDGLFVFDICLPPAYPQEPPMVFYNSGGLRVNPNLYESGKVCLSLLNTWTGSGNEVWSPESSTILQVLLSLQALVLNEKPYFNEAGYDTQIGKAEGEKNSVSYNENAFLVSCKSMMYLLRKPPKHFEGLIEEHFRQHCEQILLACKAYMKGAPVGSPFSHNLTQEEYQKGNSTGFKIMLSKLFPRLVEAFSEKGIDCSNLLVDTN